MSRLLGALFLGLVAPLPAKAAEPPSAPALAELSLEELANLEITSVSRKPERLADAPASVFIITRDAIRRSGVTSLPEALRLAPNLEVARVDTRQYAISARGFNSTTANKLLVLIDGRTVYTPLFSGVFWDAQDVLLEDIDRIEVISGPGGTLWGTNAVVGVINVITRSSSDTQGGVLSLGAGNREDAVGARFGGRLGEAGNYRLYAKAFDRDATRREGGAPGHDAFRMRQGGFRADWGSGSRMFVLQGDAYAGRFEQTAPGTPTVSGFNVLGRTARELESGARLQWQVYFDRTERDIPGTFGERLDTVDVEFQHGLRPHGAHAVTWGAGYRRAWDRVRNTPALAFLPADVDLTWWNLYAQDEIALRDDLRLTAGLRVEHNDYSGSEFLPSLRIAWKLSSSRLLWGALSRAVRSPSRIDREFFVPAQPPFLLAGGPDFRSEVSNVVEIGYRAQPASRVSFSVTAFRHDHDHLRSLEQLPNGTLVIGNHIEGTTTGLEAWGRYHATPHWQLSAGTVLLRQRLRLKSESTATSTAGEGNDPRSHWLLRSSLDLPDRQEFDVTVRRVGALPAPPVPAYWTADARYGRQLGRGLDLSLVGQNLLGRRRHVEFGPATVPRAEFDRRVFLRLQWHF